MTLSLHLLFRLWTWKEFFKGRRAGLWDGHSLILARQVKRGWFRRVLLFQIGPLDGWALLVTRFDAEKTVASVCMLDPWQTWKIEHVFTCSYCGSFMFPRKPYVTYTLPFCFQCCVNQVLGNKSVAQVSLAQRSFLKQIPELSTHLPCN